MFTLAKRAQLVRIDEAVANRPRGNATTRSKETDALEFWERRSGKKLALRSAREIQSNIEGLIGLLGQWDREDRAESNSAVRLREQDDVSKH